MTKNPAKRIADIARNTSYVFLMLQWLWVILLYSSWTIESGALQTYLDATQTSAPQEPILYDLPQFIQQPLAAMVLVIIGLLSVVLLVRAPKKATQVTIQATKGTARSITPVVQKLAHVPKNHTKQFAEKVLIGVIAALSVLACVLTIPIMHNLSLPASTSWVVSVWLSILAIGTLVLSTVISYFSRKRTPPHNRDV